MGLGILNILRPGIEVVASSCEGNGSSEQQRSCISPSWGTSWTGRRVRLWVSAVNYWLCLRVRADLV